MERCDNCFHIDECVVIEGRLVLCPRCYAAYMSYKAARTDDWTPIEQTEEQPHA